MNIFFGSKASKYYDKSHFLVKTRDLGVADLCEFWETPILYMGVFQTSNFQIKHNTNNINHVEINFYTPDRKYLTSKLSFKNLIFLKTSLKTHKKICDDIEFLWFLSGDKKVYLPRVYSSRWCYDDGLKLLSKKQT